MVYRSSRPDERNGAGSESGNGEVGGGGVGKSKRTDAHVTITVCRSTVRIEDVVGRREWCGRVGGEGEGGEKDGREKNGVEEKPADGFLILR